MTMTLKDALAEVKRARAEWTGDISGVTGHRAKEAILRAAASGDLIPASDHELAVAEALRMAGEAVPSGWTGEPHRSNMDWGPNVSIVARRKIATLADTDHLAQVQALRAERDDALERNKLLLADHSQMALELQAAIAVKDRQTDCILKSLAVAEAKLAALVEAGDALIDFHNGPLEAKRPDMWQRLISRFAAALAAAKPAPTVTAGGPLDEGPGSMVAGAV